MKGLGLLEVSKKLGQGGQACVYEAKLPTSKETDEDTPKYVAAKMFIRDQTGESCDHEHKMLELCKPSRNIIQSYGKWWGKYDEPILALDLLKYDLDGFWERFRFLMDSNLQNYEPPRISEVHAQFLSYSIINGCKEVHSNKIVHYDLKPSNVLIHEDGTPKLCDFGIARLKNSTPKTTINGGTTMYKAPELLFGTSKVHESSDIWSLGCLLFEAVFGVSLFENCTEYRHVMNLRSIFGRVPELSFDSNIVESISMPGAQHTTLRKHFESRIDSSPYSGAFKISFWDLLEKMLLLDPMSRISAQTLIGHDFFSEFRSDSALEKTRVSFKAVLHGVYQGYDNTYERVQEERANKLFCGLKRKLF